MIERVLDCGCAAVLEDDGVHAYPCTPRHYHDIMPVAEALAAELGIDVEVWV